MLVIESRRYRFFDVYRARVRRLERSYYAQVFSPAADMNEDDWARVLAEDLRRPMFRMSQGQAFARRLRRNYIWMFLILLLAWLLKISSPKMQSVGTPIEFTLAPEVWVSNATVGPIAGWLGIAGVGVFYGGLLYAALRPFKAEGEIAYGDVHV